ncbi:hypothetical protein C8034_v003941 [Colletotrichum sidae]|uniref:Uncharacterized protein n=1 Tax=Colletotrichum sidae TaxID=1347389 RepID=A0A4R8TPD2_9PEZI|nr:hypothetical protein C8034_v003941 [Colletotrichum sidae]
MVSWWKLHDASALLRRKLGRVEYCRRRMAHELRQHDAVGGHSVASYRLCLLHVRSISDPVRCAVWTEVWTLGDHTETHRARRRTKTSASPLSAGLPFCPAIGSAQPPPPITLDRAFDF